MEALSQMSLSYLRHLIWNDLPDDIKLSNNVNMFKHNVKKQLPNIITEYTMGKFPPSSPHLILLFSSP